uniref:CSON000903 protein n=1 Tax=Culicoides sonorensis TaxID=179676 RepID=A0A336LQC8_CULSO
MKKQIHSLNKEKCVSGCLGVKYRSSDCKPETCCKNLDKELRKENDYVCFDQSTTEKLKKYTGSVKHCKVSTRCNENPNRIISSAKKLEHLPIKRKKRVETSHLDNYFLFDPKTDFYNERERLLNTIPETHAIFEANSTVISVLPNNTECTENDSYCNIEFCNIGDFFGINESDSTESNAEPRKDKLVNKELIDKPENHKFQYNIYTEWANYYLERKSKRKIINLSEDIRDGLILAELIEVVTSIKVIDLHKKPKNQKQMLDNINFCLNLLKQQEINGIDDITPEDICSGRLKSILSLFFALSRYKQANKQREISSTNTSIPVSSDFQHHKKYNQEKVRSLPLTPNQTGRQKKKPSNKDSNDSLNKLDTSNVRCEKTKNKKLYGQKNSLNSLQNPETTSTAQQTNISTTKHSGILRLFSKEKPTRIKSQTNNLRASSSSGFSSAKSDSSISLNDGLTSNKSKLLSEPETKGYTQTKSKFLSSKTPKFRNVQNITQSVDYYTNTNITIVDQKCFSEKLYTPNDFKTNKISNILYNKSQEVKGEQKIKGISNMMTSSSYMQSPVAKPVATVKGTSKTAFNMIQNPDNYQEQHQNLNLCENKNLRGKHLPMTNLRENSLMNSDSITTEKKTGEVDHVKSSILPMKQLLKGYNNRVTLPRSVKTSENVKSEYDEKTKLQGYNSDSDALTRARSTFYDTENGYFSEGGSTQLKLFLKNRQKLPTTIEEKFFSSVENILEHVQGSMDSPSNNNVIDKKKVCTTQNQVLQNQHEEIFAPQRDTKENQSPLEEISPTAYLKDLNRSKQITQSEKSAAVTAVPRSKKVSGGTQTATNDFSHKVLHHPQYRSFSLTGQGATQLSQSVKERFGLGTKSLPKSGLDIKSFSQRNPTAFSNDFVCYFRMHNRSIIKYDGSLSDTQTYAEVKPDYSVYSLWLNKSNTANHLSDGESIESTSYPSLQRNYKVLNQREPSLMHSPRLNRSNSIRSTKSEKLYPPIFNRGQDVEIEPYYCLPVGSIQNETNVTWSQPSSPTLMANNNSNRKVPYGYATIRRCGRTFNNSTQQTFMKRSRSVPKCIESDLIYEYDQNKVSQLSSKTSRKTYEADEINLRLNDKKRDLNENYQNASHYENFLPELKSPQHINKLKMIHNKLLNHQELNLYVRPKSPISDLNRRNCIRKNYNQNVESIYQNMPISLVNSSEHFSPRFYENENIVKPFPSSCDNSVIHTNITRSPSFFNESNMHAKLLELNRNLNHLFELKSVNLESINDKNLERNSTIGLTTAHIDINQKFRFGAIEENPVKSTRSLNESHLDYFDIFNYKVGCQKTVRIKPKVPWYELALKKDNGHSCPSLNDEKAHVVSAFEQSLSNMTTKLHQLTATTEKKDSEILEMRQTIELLRKQSIQAGLTTVHMQSMGVKSRNPTNSVASTNVQYQKDSKKPVSKLPQSSHELTLQRQHSSDSMCSLNSISSGCSIQDKKKKKGWLRSSFSKAFSRNAKISKTDRHVFSQSSNLDLSDQPITLIEMPKQQMIENNVLLIDNAKPIDAVDLEGNPLVEDLKKQLREKDMVLTDIRLEALSSASQLENLKETVIKMREEMKTLKQNNERLQRLITSRSLADSAVSLGISPTGDQRLSLSTENSCTGPVNASEIEQMLDCQLNEMLSILQPLPKNSEELPTTQLSPIKLSKISSTIDTELSSITTTGEVPDGKKIAIAVFLGQPECFSKYAEELTTGCSSLSFPNSVESQVMQDQNAANALVSDFIQNEFVIAFTYISGKTTWQNLDYVVRKTFKEYLAQIDPGYNLGLNTDSISSYYLGEAKRGPEISLPELLPCGYIVGHTNTLFICLQGVSSLSFDSLIPRGIVNRYVNLLSEHRRLILCGPSGTGKSYIAKKLAEFLTEKSETEIIATFNVDNKSNKELKQYLDHISEQATNNKYELPSVIILENLHQASELGEVFSSLLNAGPKLPYLIATMSQSTCNATNLQLHHNFRWILLANHMEPVKGLLARYLRRKLYLLQLSTYKKQPQLEAQMMWLPLVWQHINKILETHCSSDITLGPRIFLDVPLDSGESEKFFINLWNTKLVPYIIEAVREGIQLYGRRGTWTDPCTFIRETWPWPVQPTSVPKLKQITVEEIGLEGVTSNITENDPLLEMLMRLQEAANCNGNKDDSDCESNVTHDSSAGVE